MPKRKRAAHQDQGYGVAAGAAMVGSNLPVRAAAKRRAAAAAVGPNQSDQTEGFSSAGQVAAAGQTPVL